MVDYYVPSSHKFQRTYKLVYTYPEDGDPKKPKSITVEPPFTLHLDVNRNTMAQSNTATFKLYNLAPNVRELIFQDNFNINRICFVDVYAGYEQASTLIFSGKVQYAYTNKDSVDIITEINAVDNDIVQNYSAHTFVDGTSKKEVLNTLINDMPNTEKGAIGNLEGNIEGNLIIMDNTFTAISLLTGNQAFIDVNKLNVLNKNEVIGDVGIYVINDESGLIGTPRRHEAFLELDMIFAPEITVGQLVEVRGRVVTQYNGQFKVLGIRHSGVISSSECGELITTLSLFAGAMLPNSNYIFSGVYSQQPLSVVVDNAVQQLTKPELNSIAGVRKYLIEKGKPPYQHMTRSIMWTDFLVNYSQQKEIPSLKVLSNGYNLAKKFQTILDTYFAGRKAKITSGWRSARHNAEIGGAKKSAHIYGRAFDFNIPGMSLINVDKIIAKVWGKRSYRNDRQGIIHIDTMNEYGSMRGDK